MIDDNVTIGPFCVIGEQVTIKSGTKIHSHVNIDGRTTIGQDNEIHPFACIGHAPQDTKYNGTDTALIIGDRNKIRESVTMHRASINGDGVTEVGSDNFFMAYSHVAHDCKIGSRIVVATGAGIAGHVHIEDNAIVGGLIGIHQFVRIGAFAMLGGMSRIVSDVPPYVIASGTDKARLYGINLIGLKRNGFTDEEINILKDAYRIMFRQSLPLQEAIARIREQLPQSDKIEHLIEFVQHARRGITR